ncbi:MAG TPA: ABC transporter substrate-binding protein [Methylomirabilota bacterium]|nr:ABC transporter substrate-binding protein [Methylomirabilota bacterium]
MTAVLRRAMCRVALVALPLGVESDVASAQPGVRVPRVSYLSPGPCQAPGHVGLRNALRRLGYVEGRDILYEDRCAEGEFGRLPELAAQLAGSRVDVICAVGPDAIHAAKNATTTIPIVMAFSGDDPVQSQFVASLARPGGNITGLTILVPDLTAKRLALLKEVAPGLTRVVALANPTNRSTGDELRELGKAAQALRLEIQVVEARDRSQLETAGAAIVKTRAGAMLVFADPILLANRERVVALASQSRLPAVYTWREYADAGGLMTYSPSREELSQRAASFVDRILRGAKPADLPIEQPTRWELVVNMKTAKHLGLTIPPSLLRLADHVIE